MEEKDRNMERDIDVVITWVDGDDPVWRARRDAYMNGDLSLLRDDVAGEVRYKSQGEIDWCVFSIFKYAPFVRNIYIVTDRQDPHVDYIKEQYFPDSLIKISIVDHTEIFRGHEEVLPTFNTNSIETMLFRVPGLSEYYIYFNDDVMLWNPVRREDFFVDGKIVDYGYWHSTFTAALCRWKDQLLGRETVGFRDGMLNSVMKTGGGLFGKFVRLQHTPHSLRRSYYEKFYSEHPGVMEGNIVDRFRERRQYNPQALQLTPQALKGEAIIRDHADKLLYLETFGHDDCHTRRSLEALENNRTALFCCLNTLASADEVTKREVKEMVDRHLGVGR